MGRLALALVLIAAGAAMFAAAGRTGDSARNGGIFRYGTTGLSVQIDPQQGYLTSAWWLQYATALKLVNWPDRPDPAGARLLLEAASSVAVSNRGKTYTFVIRKAVRDLRCGHPLRREQDSVLGETAELHRVDPLQQQARPVQGQHPHAKGRQLGPEPHGVHRRGRPARGVSMDASPAAGIAGLDRNEEAPALLAGA